MFPPEYWGVDWFYILSGRRARNPRRKKQHSNAASSLQESLIASLILFSSKWLVTQRLLNAAAGGSRCPQLTIIPEDSFLTSLMYQAQWQIASTCTQAPIRPRTEADLLPLSTRAGFHCIYCFCRRGQLRLSNGAWVPGSPIWVHATTDTSRTSY